jgi:octanoyl-[GcvH]:protein N-octanoyltransferase
MHTTLISGRAGRLDWALNETADLKLTRRLLEAVSKNPDLGTIVRIYRPAPTVAFSSSEKRLPGFQEAVAEARAFGFEPVIRPAGGRMVALDESWLVMDIIWPEQVRGDNRKVYLDVGAKLVKMLTDLGIQAQLGPVPLEYCPGDYSINARNQVKIFGTAQRVMRGARLFSACIPFDISFNVLELFNRVNKQLGLEWFPGTLGSVSQEAPGLSIDELEAKLRETFAGDSITYATLTDIFIRSESSDTTEPSRELANA